jgi:[ribosomal protein S5]-alanine N-acetyltransferase
MSLPESHPTLSTERLLLRPFVPSDAAEVQRLAGAPEIASTTLNVPHPYEDGLAEAWIETHESAYSAGRQVSFAVVQAGGGVLVGAMGLSIEAAHSRAELGYWVGVPFWNLGYATEAGIAILRFAFDVVRLNRVFANHLARNPASGRVLKKIGMRHEGTLRQHVEKWGVHEDIALYGIVASDGAASRPGSP